MKLPNAAHAYVDLAKLRDYALNPIHERGKHKARVFASVLGLTSKDAVLLRSALLEAAKSGEAVKGNPTDYGQLYVLDFKMETPQGSAMLRSGWIVRVGENFPRLTTVYIL